MSALNRKLIRDLWHIRGQVLAIALVVGCGVATLTMSLGAMDSLDEALSAYYERNRFADVFARVKRAPERLAERIAQIPGVKQIETRIVENVTLDVPGMLEPATGRLVSIPETRRPALNDLVIRRGRYIAPGRVDEVLLGAAFAEAHGFAPGDSLFAIINGRKRRLQIVGIALSPDHIYAIGGGFLTPDDRRFGVLWMGREALAAAFDLDDAFNDLSLTLLRGASAPAVIDALDTLLDPYGGFAAHDRDDHVSHAFVSNEMDEARNMARIVPPIFLAVAAFLLNVAVSRLIEAERGQIGLLKACGYGGIAIGWYYIKLILVVVALGLLIGFVAGGYLGRTITEIYTMHFQFPYLYYRPNPDVYVIAASVALGTAIVATVGGVWRAIRLPAAVAMRPPAPAVYRRGLLDTALFGAALGGPARMILRHILRWPGRAAVTTLGLSLGVGILVAVMFFYDAIDHMVETYFHSAQRQDVTLSFVEAQPDSILDEVRRLPAVMAAEPYRAVATRLRHGHLVERRAIVGLASDGELHRVLDRTLLPISMPEKGLVLSGALADLLNVGRGDRLTVEVLEGKRPLRQISVSAVVEEYIGTPVYMDRLALSEIMEEAPAVSGVYLQVDSQNVDALYRELKSIPAVAAITSHTAALKTFRETMAETIYIMISFYIVFGALIAGGVVYNSGRILLSDLARDLASLRVLGFTRFEVSYILLGELAILTLLALPLGCLVGYGLARIMVSTFQTELFRIPLIVTPGTYAFAVTVVIVTAVVTGLAVRRRLDKLDLVAVLKTRE